MTADELVGRLEEIARDYGELCFDGCPFEDGSEENNCYDYGCAVLRETIRVLQERQ